MITIPVELHCVWPLNSLESHSMLATPFVVARKLPEEAGQLRDGGDLGEALGGSGGRRCSFASARAYWMVKPSLKLPPEPRTNSALILVGETVNLRNPKVGFAFEPWKVAK